MSFSPEPICCPQNVSRACKRPHGAGFRRTHQAAAYDPDVLRLVGAGLEVGKPVGLMDLGVVVQQDEIVPRIELSNGNVVALGKAEVGGVADQSDPCLGLQILDSPVGAGVVHNHNAVIGAAGTGAQAFQTAPCIRQAIPSEDDDGNGNGGGHRQLPGTLERMSLVRRTSSRNAATSARISACSQTRISRKPSSS